MITIFYDQILLAFENASELTRRGIQNDILTCIIGFAELKVHKNE